MLKTKQSDKIALGLLCHSTQETYCMQRFATQSHYNGVGKLINAAFTSHGRNIFAVFQPIKPTSKS